MSTVDSSETRSRLLAFIPKFLIGLSIAVGAALIALVVFLVMDGQKNQRLVEATVQLEKLDELHGKYSTADAASKDGALAELKTAVEAIAAAYPQTYYHQRGEYLLATVAYENKDYSAAEAQFLKTIDVLPMSYLSSVCLFNAAIAAEAAGKNDQAATHLERLAKDFAQTSAEVPRALINLGRLAEEAGEFIKAGASYTRVVDEFPSSDWTKIARDRIIFLKTQGKL